MLNLSDSAADRRVSVKSAMAKIGPELLAVDRVSKRYEIYERPQDRLKQFIVPRLQVMLPPALKRAQPFYKEFWALREVSLSVNRGEAIGILGRNGAGKSTLLQIVAGTLEPTSGAVAVHGKTAALLELGSGFSPEFTGRENVLLNAALLGLSSRDTERRFAEIEAFADIGEFIEQPVRMYSSGMMMRLAFAVQTAVEPELLIVDEALSVGDARFQKKCFARLEQLRRQGTTILLVTHDTGTVVQFCSRALVLESGRVVAEGEPAKVAHRYHQLLFGDEKVVVSLPGSNSVAAAVEQEKPVAERLASAEALTSSREVRYGTREADIFEVGIRDALGQETRVVEIHGTYEFHFKARFNLDVPNALGYGFIISNQRGVEIFATKAGLYGKALPPSHAGSIYECCFRAAVPIACGTYFLSVAIAHDDARQRNEFPDCRFDVLQFQIVGQSKAFTTCIFDMPGELSHRSLASGGQLS